MADDALAARMAEFRLALVGGDAEACYQAGRTLWDALNAVLAPHAPRTDLKHGRSCAGHRLDGFAPVPGCGLCTQDEHRQVCPECRDSFGDPVPFGECRARKRALGALKGESGG